MAKHNYNCLTWWSFFQVKQLELFQVIQNFTVSTFCRYAASLSIIMSLFNFHSDNCGLHHPLLGIRPRQQRVLFRFVEVLHIREMLSTFRFVDCFVLNTLSFHCTCLHAILQQQNYLQGLWILKIMVQIYSKIYNFAIYWLCFNISRHLIKQDLR